MNVTKEVVFRSSSGQKELLVSSDREKCDERRPGLCDQDSVVIAVAGDIPKQRRRGRLWSISVEEVGVGE